MAITKEQLFAVADELRNAGKKPTREQVREALGGGSYTWISPWMGEWEADREAKAAREPAPPSVAKRLTELGTEIWALASALAHGRLEGERAALDATRAQLESEKREALELADKLSAKLETSQGRVEMLEGSERAAQSELAAVNERAVIAEVRAIEIERRADDLSAELARLNGHNATLAKALAAKAQHRGPSKQERRQ